MAASRPTPPSTPGRSYQNVGLAVDGSGDVFYLEGGDSAVQEILAVNGSIPANPTIITEAGLGIDFVDPTSVTVDGAGDVYVTDAGFLGEWRRFSRSMAASRPTPPSMFCSMPAVANR